MTTAFSADRPLIGISLKMYFSLNKTRQYLTELADRVGSHPAVVSGDVQVLIFPGFLALAECESLLGHTPIRWGGQDVHWEPSGAFTGEVGILELVDAGCSSVEVAHKERIEVFGETPDTIAKKVAVCLAHGVTPLVCIGEKDQVDPAQAAAECMAQVVNFTTLARSLGHTGSILYAYEPYWAIGAAEAAPPEYVTEVAGLIRDRLDPADGNLLIYGGTAGPGLLPQVYPVVGGLFLGRNSHDVGNVVTVVDEASRLP